MTQPTTRSPSPFLLAAMLLAGIGVTYTVQALTADGADQISPTTVDAARVESLETSVESLTTRIEQLLGERSIESGTIAADAVVRESTGLSEADVRRIVAEAIAEGGGEVVDGFDLEASLAEIDRIGAFGNGADQFWDKLRDEGHLDAVVAAFAERAERNPESADAQADYGNALIEKLRRADNQVEVSRLAMQADAAYDEALEIDPEHWGARFSKAISYSFWPAITGKPAEAMRHFETLIDQQSGKPSRPEYAQSYLLLGNLHSQRGDLEKAREVWSQGARLYPNDTQLRDQLSR